MSDPYKDERHCDHCQADTPHKCQDSNHERDSTGDQQTCLVCGWWRSGFDGKYYPPSKYDGDE